MLEKNKWYLQMFWFPKSGYHAHVQQEAMSLVNLMYTIAEKDFKIWVYLCIRTMMEKMIKQRFEIIKTFTQTSGQRLNNRCLKNVQVTQ